MNKVIRTEYYTTTSTGAARIVAKFGSKQRTHNYDHSKSSAWNHGTAAGVLAKHLGWKWSDSIEHDSNDSGTKHGFKF